MGPGFPSSHFIRGLGILLFKYAHLLGRPVRQQLPDVAVWADRVEAFGSR